MIPWRVSDTAVVDVSKPPAMQLGSGLSRDADHF